MFQDEHTFWASPIARMASTPGWNPNRFAHPGSTLYYPLALVYRLYHLISLNGAILRPDPNLWDSFALNPAPYILMGRLLSASYMTMSIPLVFLAGRRVFDNRTGILAGLSLIATSLLLRYVQLLRSDGASMFFVCLALLMCLRLYDRPTLGRQLAAGLAIGLAISTKYYLGVLVVPLGLVDLMILMGKAGGEVRDTRRRWFEALAGMLAVPLSFALTTPYFFLDLETALGDLRKEMRTSHLGADGLSPTGNLIWYVRTAIPDIMGGLRSLLALGGLILVVHSRNIKVSIFAVYAITFLMAISRSPLHWAHWAFPILPVLTLLFAFCIVRIADWVARWFGQPERTYAILVVLAMLALARPGYDVAIRSIQRARTSTHLLTRGWLVEHLSTGTAIATEHYTAPLEQTDFQVWRSFALGNQPMDYYLGEGYRHFVISDTIYDRFFQEEERYPAQVAFYRRLMDEGTLLARFDPAWNTGGAAIQVYRWDGE
jgi:4-amino-4-deoxy-L-arabinose transferase-like glycosyltransferase